MSTENFKESDLADNFSFIEQSLEDSLLPMNEFSTSTSPSNKDSGPKVQADRVLSFGEGFIPLPIDALLRPACAVSQALSFGDLYSSLVCIDHKSDITSVYVSTGTAFFFIF